MCLGEFSLNALKKKRLHVSGGMYCRVKFMYGEEKSGHEMLYNAENCLRAVTKICLCNVMYYRVLFETGNVTVVLCIQKCSV